MHRVQEIYRFIHYLLNVLQGHKCSYLIEPPCSQTASSIHRHFCWAFLSSTARMESIAPARGAGLDWTWVVCYEYFHFLHYYMRTWGVWANNFQIHLRPALLSAKSPVLLSSGSHKSFHTNIPLISWTERNARTLELLWGEWEFDWQGPALDFCWIKNG